MLTSMGTAILHMLSVYRTQAMPGVQGVLDSLGNLMQIENGDLRVLVRSATQVYMKYCAYLNCGPMKLHRLTFTVRPTYCGFVCVIRLLFDRL